jgi:hypothetical protein
MLEPKTFSGRLFLDHLFGWKIGVARFLLHGTTYENCQKYTKWQQPVPNGHKMYHMTVNIPNSNKIYQHFIFARLSKNVPKLVLLVWKYTICMLTLLKRIFPLVPRLSFWIQNFGCLDFLKSEIVFKFSQTWKLIYHPMQIFQQKVWSTNNYPHCRLSVDFFEQCSFNKRFL